MNRRSFTALLGASATTAAILPTAAATSVQAKPGRGASEPKTPTPYVVGHRGASGYRPEHTLAAYELAARMGADFIEPDLVITKDGVLVCRHEPEIGGTTDVAQHPEFASRKTTKSLDGTALTGWFAEDFTLKELRTLRAVERLPKERQQNTIYDGLWTIPTFEDVLKLRAALSKELGRDLGVYPETKHPTYFRDMGKPLEEKLVPLLKKFGLDKRSAPVRVQSFELKNLIMLREEMGVRAPLVFLTSAKGGPYGDDRTYAQLLTPEVMATYADTVNGLGPDWALVVSKNSDGSLGTPTDLVKDAHALGLEVCPYTVRAENTFLPTDYRVGDDPYAYGRVLDFFNTLYATGIDGIFSDNPDAALVARDLFHA